MRQNSKDNLISRDPQSFLTAKDIECGSSFDHLSRFQSCCVTDPLNNCVDISGLKYLFFP